MLGSTFGHHPHTPARHCDQHDRLVDRFLGDSYPVVREVYLHLDEVQALYPNLQYLAPVAELSEELGLVGQNIDAVTSVAEQADNGNLDKIIDLTGSIKTLAKPEIAEGIKNLSPVANEIKSVSDNWEDVKVLNEEVKDSIRTIAPYVEPLSELGKPENLDNLSKVGGDLTGHYVDMGILDLGTFVDDPDKVFEVTGGTIAKVAENIDVIRQLNQAIDENVLNSLLEQIGVAQGDYNTSVNIYRELDESIKENTEAYKVKAEEVEEKVNEFENSLVPQSKQEIIDLTEASKQSIIELSNTYSEDFFKAVDTVTEIKDLFLDPAGEIQQTITNATAIKNDLDGIVDTVTEASRIASESAKNSGFAFRYCAYAASGDTIAISSCAPNKLLKAGDYVVNANGEVYPVVNVDEYTFTVGNKVTTLKGDKGEPGTGLNLLDSYDSVEELVEAHPTGSTSDVYIVQEEVYLWSPEKQSWVNVGPLKGAKGDDGLSANEILMTPDPVAYFDELYGIHSGDIIGSLNIQMAPLPISPEDLFDNALNG